jgi:3-deoxy-7-phosphoheptulonate synthase
MDAAVLEAWRDRPAAQQPDWPDPAAVIAVTGEIARLPPLVFAGECDSLKDRLAAVARGEAFVLQGASSEPCCRWRSCSPTPPACRW